MRLIEHIIFTEIENGKNLMINSINGLIDKVDIHSYEIIAKWKECEMIVPDGETETVLYNNLKSRGYLVSSRKEENQEKEKVLQSLRNKHAKVKANRSNLTFVMTYDCNFRCSYCFEDAGVFSNVESDSKGSQRERNKKSVITPELIDAAFGLVGDELKTVGIFGGEPLLPSTKGAFSYIASKAPDKSYKIITNGYYIEEFSDILTKINISQIMVTIDGEEETHNSRRCLPNGKPTYKKIMSGIIMCLKNGIPVCIRMNLDETNFSEVSDLKLRLIDELSAYKGLLSFEASPMIKAAADERNQMFLELYKDGVMYPIKEMKIRNRMLGKFTPIVNAITTGTTLRPLYSFCHAHNSGLLVDPYGKIFPCLLAVGIDGLAIGSYYPQIRFYENSIRHRNIDAIPECRRCKYSLLCGGGCPVAISDHSDIFKPECFTVLNEIHNVMPLFFVEKEKTYKMLNNDRE